MQNSLVAIAVALITTCGVAPLCRGQASDGPHQKVATAQKALSKAEADLKTARAKVDAAVQSTPEWSEAVNARKDAQDKYDELSRAAVQALQNNPAYKAAVANKHEVERRRETLRHDPDATPEQRTELATEMLAASSAVSRLERNAGAADPAIAQARNALAAANTKLASLQQGLEARYKDDKDVQATTKLVDDDKAALAQATKEIHTQQAQQTAAQNSSGGGGGGHGGGGGRKR